MHRKCRAVDAIKPAEVELRQDPIHVAWVQTTAGEDRDQVHANRRTLHQILNLCKESGSDFRSRTEDGPACQQYNEKLLLPAEAAAIHPTIAHNGSHEDIGPFPRIKSRGLLQQHFLRSHERCPAKVAIRSQRGGVTNTRNLTTSCLCSWISFIGFPFANAPSSKLQSLFEIHSVVVARHTSVDPASPFRKSGREPTFVLRHEAPHHTSNQDTSLRGKKLPCLRTGCVELPARRHRKSRTVTGTFQDWIENSSISSGICLAALTAPM